jgi:hypothetical protein
MAMQPSTANMSNTGHLGAGVRGRADRSDTPASRIAIRHRTSHTIEVMATIFIGSIQRFIR